MTAKGPSRRGGSRVWTRRAHRTSSTLRQASCGRQTQQTLQAAAAPQTLSSVLFSPSSTPPPPQTFPQTKQNVKRKCDGQLTPLRMAHHPLSPCRPAPPRTQPHWHCHFPGGGDTGLPASTRPEAGSPSHCTDRRGSDDGNRPRGPSVAEASHLPSRSDTLPLELGGPSVNASVYTSQNIEIRYLGTQTTRRPARWSSLAGLRPTRSCHRFITTTKLSPEAPSPPPSSGPRASTGQLFLPQQDGIMP